MQRAEAFQPHDRCRIPPAAMGRCTAVHHWRSWPEVLGKEAVPVAAHDARQPRHRSCRRRARPSSILPKSRLSRNQSGIGGKPGFAGRALAVVDFLAPAPHAHPLDDAVGLVLTQVRADAEMLDAVACRRCGRSSRRSSQVCNPDLSLQVMRVNRKPQHAAVFGDCPHHVIASCCGGPVATRGDWRG